MLTVAEYRAFLEPHKVLFAPPCITPYTSRLAPTQEPTISLNFRLGGFWLDVNFDLHPRPRQHINQFIHTKTTNLPLH